jgi:hypothetical protein
MDPAVLQDEHRTSSRAFLCDLLEESRLSNSWLADKLNESRLAQLRVNAVMHGAAVNA